MKQSWTLVWLLCLAVITIRAQAAAVEDENIKDTLERRATRSQLGSRCGNGQPKCGKKLYCPADGHCAPKGVVGAPCLSRNRCLYSAVCYEGTCYGDSDRPINAPCSADVQCAAEYCAKGPGICRTPRKNGSRCNRNVQCASKSCDSTSKKCIASSGPTTISSKAAAALASATPVPDSSKYTANDGPVKGDGEIRTSGSVTLVDTSNGRAVEMLAFGSSPAVIQNRLKSPLQRRQTSAEQKKFTFNYDVVNFTTTDSTSGTCSVVASINDVQLSPPITIKDGTLSGTGLYFVSGSVSNYAVALVCDDASRARLQFDALEVSSVTTTTTTAAPVSTSSTNSPTTTSTSFTTTSSTTASSTTTTASSTTTSQMPTNTVVPPSCSGLTNCGFETGTDANLRDSSTSDSTCSITNDPSFVHAGTYADKCELNATSRFSFICIDGGNSNGTDYVVGNEYELSFWAQFTSGANSTGLSCTITPDRGASSSYRGVCPLSAAEPENGFYKHVLPFNATSTAMGFYVFMRTVSGTYTFDDFSVLLTGE